MCLMQLWQIVALRDNCWLQPHLSPKAAIKSHFAFPGSVRWHTSDSFLLPNKVLQFARQPLFFLFLRGDAACAGVTLGVFLLGLQESGRKSTRWKHGNC